MAITGAAAVRTLRIAAGVGAGVAGAFALTQFVGGVSSGIIGGIPGKDPYADGDPIHVPNELLENDHYIEFLAKKTDGMGSGLLNEIGLGAIVGTFGGGGTTTLGGTVRLPMPSQLSTDYNPEYSTPDLGAAAGMLLKPSDQAIYGNNTMGNQAMAGNSMQGLVNAVGGGAKGLAVKTAVSAVGENNAGAALKVTGGVAVNPHKIALFTGVNFREHQFSWKLSPKNRRESDKIRQIIELFTYYSHPEYVAGGLFFK
jgi:hypothetical protein